MVARQFSIDLPWWRVNHPSRLVAILREEPPVPIIHTKPTIPDHELIRDVGSGAFGVVWLGRNVLGSYRAVKVVYRRSFPAQRPYDREYAGLMRYEPLSRGHPGLVSILHVGCNPAEQYFFYTMEVADDVARGRTIDAASYEPRTLRSDLLRHQKLEVAECARVTLLLCSALGYLHRHGVVHRDIKPSNIIFVDDQPKFADIGLVENIGEASTVFGSDGYMPPEGPGKPTADLFGLGKVLYELVTGEDQLRFPELPAELDSWPDATARRRLHEVAVRACKRNPQQRYQTAEEMQAQLQRAAGETGTSTTTRESPPRSLGPLQVVVLGEPGAGPAADVLPLIERELASQQCAVFIDRATSASVEWVQEVENRIAAAHLVIALLTPTSAQSEIVGYELELARGLAQQNGGRPRIFPLEVDLPSALRESVTNATGGARGYTWLRSNDPAQSLRELMAALRSPQGFQEVPTPARLETVGGAVPLDSPFYLQRPADAEFHAAILAPDVCIVLVKGARQMGKTSLLARGLQQAREHGRRVALTDFQQLNVSSFETIEHFYLALGHSLADALDLDTLPEDVWNSSRTPNINFERYLKREVLGNLTTHLVWGIDELDRLFPCRFGSEVFGLIRSWHNHRALDPASPWWRVTLAMAYATEAHLLISDPNQSPFNVGTRVQLHDFTPEQVAELNRLYGSPIPSLNDLADFTRLVGGQPYLVRRGLHELATRRLSFEAFRARADREDGVFGDHLRRLVFLLAKDPGLVDAMRGIARGGKCPTQDAFYRLRAAGVIVGDLPEQARARCQLYGTYLQRNL